MCVCVHGVFSCFLSLEVFLSVSCNCSVSGTPNATPDDDLMKLDPSTLATHSSFSLVPRPCMFVTCSVKFTQNFALEATNVQGLGTRLLQSCFLQIMVVASYNFQNSCTSKTKAQSGSLSCPQTLRMACEREEVLLTAVGSHVRRWFPWLSRLITSRVEVVSTSRRPATTMAPLLSSLRSRIPLDGFRRSRIISLYIWVGWERNLLQYFVLDYIKVQKFKIEIV